MAKLKKNDSLAKLKPSQPWFKAKSWLVRTQILNQRKGFWAVKATILLSSEPDTSYSPLLLNSLAISLQTGKDAEKPGASTDRKKRRKSSMEWRIWSIELTKQRFWSFLKRDLPFDRISGCNILCNGDLQTHNSILFSVIIIQTGWIVFSFYRISLAKIFHSLLAWYRLLL